MSSPKSMHIHVRQDEKVGCCCRKSTESTRSIGEADGRNSSPSLLCAAGIYESLPFFSHSKRHVRVCGGEGRGVCSTRAVPRLPPPSSPLTSSLQPRKIMPVARSSSQRRRWTHAHVCGRRLCLPHPLQAPSIFLCLCSSPLCVAVLLFSAPLRVACAMRNNSVLSRATSTRTHLSTR